MFVIKFEKDHGHYKSGDEVRLEESKATPFLNGGYAIKMGEVKEKKMAKAPENKSAPKKKPKAVENMFKKVMKRKKASNEE
jgi:hypothetical protein